MFFIAFIVINAQAQVRIDSPYSRYGIGDLNLTNNAKTMAIGGLSFSINDAARINSNNPASYAAIDSSSFVFDAGFSGLMLESKATSGVANSNYFNLAHLKVAMPITRWLRTSIGLMPFSSMGYDVSGTADYDSIGTVESRYHGTGGLNQVYLGAGIKIIRNLYVGANASYIFGTAKYNRETIMPDVPLAFKYRATSEVVVGDMYFDYGAQYRVRLSNKKTDKLKQRDGKFLQLGFVYANKQKLTTTLNQTGVTFTSGSDGFDFIKDTIYLKKGAEGKTVIPAMIGGGFSFYGGDKWMFGFDIRMQNWEQFEAFGFTDSLSTSSSYHIGGSYKIKGVEYRIGARYLNSYLELKNHNINDYGISFGVGFPLRKNSMTVSHVDLGFEFGRRGTTADGLIEQNYFKVNLGVAIRNTWFQRAKYN